MDEWGATEEDFAPHRGDGVRQRPAQPRRPDAEESS